MTERRRLIVVTVCVVAVAIIVLLIVPRARQMFAPVPTRALIAVQAGSESAARIGGAWTLPAGTPFRLYAVLEARTREGHTVYFSDAPALEVGDRRVSVDDVSTWDQRLDARVLWFTIEGAPAFVDAANAEAQAAFKLREIHRPNWPQAWSVPGSVQPRSQTLAGGREKYGPLRFGTAAYQVRILLFGPESQIRPRERYESPGAEVLLAQPDSVARVTVKLPGALGPASAVFGLPEFESDPDAGVELTPRLQRILHLGLAFRHAAVIAATLEVAGRRWVDLSWRPLDLEEGPKWGAGGVRAGDLLRSGGRIVLLWRDADGSGRLSAGDLCFDMVKGPAVRSLSEVFSGSGLVEWAALSAPAGVDSELPATH
jgi:hypothetical protein